ncbi:MAG: PorP/SprF family type IX secretion system membrane protein [Bacteroidia bacterium]|nr:PorP/SprF family type IX secretion system membrane protein [Bacteroidia bacterium]
MKKRIGTYLIGLLATGLGFQTTLKAQDPEFSQFYAAPLYTNPAMAGTAQCNRRGSAGRAAVNYRNQWPNLPGTFVTTAFSVDQHIDGIGGGLGLLAVRDVAGEGLLTSSSLSGIYSYHLAINRKLSMRFGLQAEVIQRRIDFSLLDWEDEIVGDRGFIGQTKEEFATDVVTTPNFSTGTVLYTSSFYAGVAVHNLIEPIHSFYANHNRNSRLPRRYTVHLGSLIPLDKKGKTSNSFSPNLLFMSQAQFTQLNVGFYLNRGPLVTGMWFRQTFGEARNSDALMLLLGFRKDRFKFGYSYDLTVDSKRGAVRGSHEISTTLEWCAKKPSPRLQNIPCPSNW